MGYNKAETIKHINAYLEEREKQLVSCEAHKREILDMLTPSFLAIMRNLPPISQSVIHYLCLTKNDLSEFLTIEFLSKKLREPSKVVSVYCALLHKYQIVNRQKSGKGYAYKMCNVAFVEWYRFRYGRRQ